MLVEPRTGRRPSRTRSIADAAAEVPPHLWLLGTVILVAALLRFATLSSQSFWIDEATTVHEVGLSFAGMLRAVAHDESTPPLYFVIAWGWTRVFGAGAYGIRSLSALAGVALVPVAYLCARDLVGRTAGVLAAAFVAVSPFMVWYSQEARAYMLFALLGGLALLFCERAARTRSRSDLVGFAVSGSLALLTHFYAIFLLVPLAVWLLVETRERRAVAAVAVLVAVQAALVPLALSDASHPLLGWLKAFPLTTRIDQIPTDFAVSQLYKNADLGLAIPEAVVLVVIVAALVSTGLRGGSTGTAPAPWTVRRGVARVGGTAAFVVLVPIALALLGRDYVFSRNFIAAWVPLAIVLAAACSSPRPAPRVIGGGLAAVVIGGSLWALVAVDGSPTLRRPDWRAVAAALGPESGPRAVVATDGNVAEEPLAVYLPRSTFSTNGLPGSSAPVSVRQLDIVANPANAPARRLPRGTRIVGDATVAQNLVLRFDLNPAWRGPPAALAARALGLLLYTPSGFPAILLER